MHRKHVLLPSREPVLACECLLFFRCPRLRIWGFRIGTRASRATSFIISTAVIWYTLLFRQNRTDRPTGEVMRQLGASMRYPLYQELALLEGDPLGFCPTNVARCACSGDRPRQIAPPVCAPPTAPPEKSHSPIRPPSRQRPRRCRKR